MFEKFSEPAIQVIMIAQQESRRLHHNFIGPEHLLLGLIAEETGVAAALLAEVGITLDNTRSEVQKLTGGGFAIPALKIRFTPRAKIAMETALEISYELSHQYIGTEHLLFGIIQEGAFASQVLDNLGVERSNLRDRIIQRLSTETQTEPQRKIETPQELFSLQPYQEPLRTLLPPMSNPAIQVWHALGSQIGWKETNIAISKIKIMQFTRLSQSEVEAAFNELISLGVIIQIEPGND